MLRIAGIQPSDEPDEEFILLQNQGVMKVMLRGHVLAKDDAWQDYGELNTDRVYAFSDNVFVPPSAYVMLKTGFGFNGWRKSKDGSPVYCVYWKRDTSAWDQHELTVHLLQVSHSKVVKTRIAERVG
jgi:hypothetical protein